MIVQFPVAQPDELLSSIIARFTRMQRLSNDKVVMEHLFGSRNVVPSPLFQGHINDLYRCTGHIWRIPSSEIIRNHTLLSLFRPFLPECRYHELVRDTKSSTRNPLMLRAGVNAGQVVWPTSFRICPICKAAQKKTLGFAYWQRLLQCPGVECCPEHRCLSVDSAVRVHLKKRHCFVSADEAEVLGLSLGAGEKQLALAELVQELLSRGDLPSVSLHQWTRFYRRSAKELGYMRGARIDHQAICHQVNQYWGPEWLQRQGLGLDPSKEHWLLAMFRKHRHPFTFLHHFVCWLALGLESKSIKDVVDKACALPTEAQSIKAKVSTKPTCSPAGRRCKWSLLLDSYDSLKDIRSTQEGATLYSWLYRYDREWLMSHKPPPVKRSRVTNKANWRSRDRYWVKRLLRMEHAVAADLSSPRHSVCWFLKQLDAEASVGDNLCKLPLCRVFFDRYGESVEEYQTRRLACVISHLMKRKDTKVTRCDVERIAGLSHQRCREPARAIIRMDLPTWQAYQTLSR